MITPTFLNNRYKVLSVLGSGGFGDTFLAEDTQMPSGRRCVIKQLKPVANSNPQVHQLVQERFQREAAILEELGENSPQIPKLYAYFNEGGEFYLVQEYIEGQTLSQRLQQQGSMSESSVKSILVDILPILSYVHSKHIVHRDIKPDNIMVRNSDGKAILIDFGAVKETMATIVTNSGNSARSIVIGTPGFMPMEQSAGRPQFSSDLYSLGLTAIYLLTGKLPQQLETNPHTGEILWRQYALNVSPSLAMVLDKCILPVARDRYPSARDMLAELQPTANQVAPTVPYNPPQYVPPHNPNPPAYNPPPQYVPPQPVQSAPTQYSIPTPQQQPATVHAHYQAGGQQQANPYQQPTPLQKSSGTWQQAVIVGGVIGSILVGGWWVMGQMHQSENQQANNSTGTSTSASTPISTPIVISSANNNSRPVTNSRRESNSSSSSNSSNNNSQPVQNTNNLISQDAAVNTVTSWIKAKGEIFAPPYTTDKGSQLLTGSAYERNIQKSSDPESCIASGRHEDDCLSSVQWLVRNNSHWVYGVQRIETVKRFEPSGNKATLVVDVTEQRTLLNSKGNVDKSQSGLFTSTVSYDLVYEDGQVKISNYN
jgi:serine/threonine protein kinase